MASSVEKSIFLQALEETSEAAREAYLAQACGDDQQLKASLKELLRAHASDSPLDQPIAEMSSGRSQLLASTDLMIPQVGNQRIGTVIGPYKLMEQIGEGGFGLVYVAEQQKPVRRRVALKIIKPGTGSQDVIARFEAERQALALMDHPNIARVFDAGTTADGSPYFVMELVRGIAITEFCSQKQLGLRDRLELFVQVCQAVQHAHQKGVIHRDIKPSNVLVTLHDEAAVAKVIDFGVAKAVGQRLTDKTIYTLFSAMIGTPLYMSPEQAEMSGLDVDTRSDIYSLGVLLYEMLTETTPFDRERFSAAGFDEVRRLIREEDPPKPSTRLTTLRSVPKSTMANRSMQKGSQKLATPSVIASVPGDLDWIVMKALEKDRRRRYDSAGSLAADIARFLAGEPIEARPPSSFYKLAKFAQRNRAMLTAASLVAMTLVLGTSISVWQAVLATSERNEKEIARREAVAARNDADAARREVEGFAERLKEANILVTGGRAHADAERWAAAYVDFTAAIERQPNYYNAWIERASLEVRLGLWKLAATDYSKALELGVPVDSPANWGIPQLFLWNDDQDSYRNYCKGMLDAAKKNGQTISIAVIRSCVMDPDPVTDGVELARMAEELLADYQAPFPPQDRRIGLPQFRPNMNFEPPHGPPGIEPFLQPNAPEMLGNGGFERGMLGPPPHDAPPNRPPPGFGWPPWGRIPFPSGVMDYVAGLTAYRAGQFDQAAIRLEQALDDKGWRSREVANAALAMAYHRSGKAKESRDAFESSAETIDTWTNEMLQSPVGRMPLPWFEWIEVKLLHREASMLLTGFAPVDDPRLREIEQRAVDAIAGNARD